MSPKPRPPASAKRRRPNIGPPPRRAYIPHPPKLPRRPLPPSRPRPKAVGRPLAGSIGSIFGDAETNTTLLDLVDNLLSKGVVLHADATLALANVDLVYLRLTAMLAAADRVFGARRKP